MFTRRKTHIQTYNTKNTEHGHFVAVLHCINSEVENWRHLCLQLRASGAIGSWHSDLAIMCAHDVNGNCEEDETILNLIGQNCLANLFRAQLTFPGHAEYVLL